VQALSCQCPPWVFLMSSTELIRTFLTDRLGVEPDQVTPQALLAELGVDSLMLAELMFEAEDRMGIEIPPDVKPPRTVAEMQAVIDSLTALKTG
jgi:acyl carrier protein